MNTMLTVYNSKIIPKIKEIDLFIKSNYIFNTSEVSKILEIDEEEINSILNFLDEKEINRKTMIYIMLNGSSYICKLIKREIERGTPEFYTPEDLAYIYEIDYEKVKNAYKFLELKWALPSQIPCILAQV